MAQAFYDNFNRANGPAGADWTTDVGTVAISGNTLRVYTNALCHPTTQPASADVCMRAWMIPPVSGTKVGSVRLRATLNQQNYVEIRWAITTTTCTVTVYKKVANNQLQIGLWSLAFTWGSTVDLMAAFTGDTVLVWCDSWLIGALSVPDLPNNGYAQLAAWNDDTYYDAFALYDLAASDLTVTVTDLQTTPPSYSLALVNSGAPWTPGTPGAPTFTCTVGTITAQTVDDADHATLTYEPPALEADSFIYDLQNDWHYKLALSSTPGGVGSGGSGGGLTTQQAQTITDLATLIGNIDSAPQGSTDLFLQLGSVILALHSAYSGGGDGAVAALLDAVLSETGSLRLSELYGEQALALLNQLMDSGSWTLQYAWGQIKGQDNRDNTELYDLIAALPPETGGNLSEILTQLAQIRTLNNYTIGHVKDWIDAIPSADVSSVLSELAAIRTANLWSLGHVMDAIGNVRGTNNPTIADTLTAISNARGTNNPTIADVLAAVNAIDTSNDTVTLAAILAAIALIPTDPIGDSLEVLDTIASTVGAISSAVGAAATILATLNQPKQIARAPIWPGLANVTLGDPVALSHTLAVSTPCDGVLVAITADDLHHGLYDWGSVTQHPRAAYLSFTHDSGAQEDVQPISFPSECLVPKMCARAAGYLVRTREGLVGTVTPWTINTP